MSNKIEDLSTELWLEIFTYLKVRHQFNAFFNLNKRLNQILFSYRTQISCKNNDEDAQYLIKYILPYLTHREDVTELRLENTKRIDPTDIAKLLHFPCLKTLILHRLHITKDFLDLFQQNMPHLRYLHISPVISGDKKCLSRLLDMILSIPNLQICYLRLGISMCSNQLQTLSKSSIKALRLIGMNENCFVDKLILLLQHLPYLHSLSIAANQLNFVPTTNTKNIFCTNSISIFRLNINELIISLVQFTDFILTLTPNVYELKIICRTPVQNLNYLNHRDWMMLIKSLPNLKKLTLDICCSNEVDKDTWDKRSQLLTKLMTKNHIVFHLGKKSS